MQLVACVEGESMGKRRGRPSKPGPRHPGGKLVQQKKPTIEPVAPALWQRIAADAKRKAADERLGSELGRLYLHGELNSPQVSAGFRLGEIYGRYERYKGKRRSTVSPSYESGRGDHSIAEELLEPETLEMIEDSIRAATEAFEKLQTWFQANNIPRGVRNAIEDLCVEDRAISPVILPLVRTVLEMLGLLFGFTTAGAAAKQVKPAEKPTAAAAQKPNIDRDCFIKVIGTLRPDLADDELRKVYEIQRALVARAVVKRSQQRRDGTNVIVLAAVSTKFGRAANADKAPLKIDAVIVDE